MMRLVAVPALQSQSTPPVVAQPGLRWHVAHTRPGREFEAERELGRQGFATFLPRMRKTVRHARQLRTKISPVFPRYVFVALDLTRDCWRRVNGTRGVDHLLAAEDGPRQVPPAVMNALQQTCDSAQHIRLDDGLRVGDRVQLLTGTFTGEIGDLMAINDNERVLVLLSILNGPHRVWMDRRTLMPVRAR